jgi:type VI secretion system protein ImpG
VVLTASLLTTNRDLPSRLNVGDLRLATRDIPAGITFRNLTIPTAAIEPVLGGDHLWRLLSHLHLDAGSVLTLPGLRGLFALYDVRAAAESGTAHLHHGHQRLAESLQSVTTGRATRHLDGAPIRGLAVTITLDEDKLGGPGDAHLLGSVLDHFLAAGVSLNSFTRLMVHCSRSGQDLRWQDRLGQRRLL